MIVRMFDQNNKLVRRTVRRGTLGRVRRWARRHMHAEAGFMDVLCGNSRGYMLWDSLTGRVVRLYRRS